MNYDSSEEYVETSDVEELEEINREKARKLACLEAQSDDEPLTRPLKRIKLTHGSDHLEHIASTPVRSIRLGRVEETPTRSQSSVTVHLDLPTSPTHISDSPGGKSRQSSVGPYVVAPSSSPGEQSQDVLLLRTPSPGISLSHTPPYRQQPERTSITPSPFLLSTAVGNRFPVSPYAPSTPRRVKSPRGGWTDSSHISSPVSPNEDPLASGASSAERDDHLPGRQDVACLLFPSPVKEQTDPKSPESLNRQSPVSNAASPTTISPSDYPMASSPLTVMDNTPEPDDLPVVPPRPDLVVETANRPIEEPVPELVQQLAQEGQRRYETRKKSGKQLKPYTYNELEYKDLVKNIPGAFVSTRHIEASRQSRDQDREGNNLNEESQDGAFVADDEEEEMSDAGGKRRKDRVQGENGSLGPRETPEERAERRRKREEERAAKALRREEREQRRKEREQREAIRQRTNQERGKNDPPVASSSKQRSSNALAQLGLVPSASEDEDEPSPPPARQRHSSRVTDAPIASSSKQRDDHAWADLNLAPSDDDDEPLPTSSRKRHSSAGAPDALLIPSDSEPSQKSRFRSRSRARSSPMAPVPTSQTKPDTEAEEQEEGSQQSEASSGSEDIPDIEQHKVKKLYKMYPKGLADILLRGKGRAKSSGQKKKAQPDDGGDAPLKPGQAKRRTGVNDPSREIKGDTESEDEASSRSPSAGPSRYDSPPPSNSYWAPSTPARPSPAPRPKRERSRSVVDRKPRFEYDSQDESDLEEIDDAAIESLTNWNRQPKKESNQKFENYANEAKDEEFLIDYMLQRTRVFGQKPRRHKVRATKKKGGSKQKQKRSSHKYDVVTGGARGLGTGKQTLISNHRGFEKEGESGKSVQRHAKKRGQSSRSGQTAGAAIEIDDDDDDSDDVAIVAEEDALADRRELLKQKAKERKAIIRAQGISILKSSDGAPARIVVGSLRRKDLVTVAIEEETAIDTVARPQYRKWEGPPGRRLVQPFVPEVNSQEARLSQPAPSRVVSEDPNLQGAEDDKEERDEVAAELFQDEKDDDPTSRILKDCGVSPLEPGTSFAMDTYIRKGLLHGLIATLGPQSERGTQPIHHVAEYKVDDDATIHAIGKVVLKALDDAFDLAAALPDPDQQVRITEWIKISHYLGQVISHRLPNMDGPQRDLLKKTISDGVHRLASRIGGMPWKASSVDATVFQVLWMAIELSVRVGEHVLNNRGQLGETSLTASIQALVNHLLIFGLENTMKAVVSDMVTKSLSEHTDATYSAEVWVRLIHLLGAIEKKEETPGKRVHVFWQFLIEGLRVKANNSVSDVALWEEFWTNTFSLCALSQFSVHGMVTATAERLPAAWDLVRWICEMALGRRDPDVLVDASYIRYLLGRLFILCERWAWKTTDIALVIKLFVDKIFAPTKFANLPEEHAEYPTFLLERPAVPEEGSETMQDSDLMTFGPKDSAYTLVLKLVVRASHEPDAKPHLIKKLLSLSEPVSVIQFGKAHPDIDQMSMVINRVTAAIVAVHITPIAQAPEVYEHRVSQLLKCISFSAANAQTRCMLIRGLRYWADFITFRGAKELCIDKLAPWAGDMAKCLGKEWVEDDPRERSRRKLLTKVLLTVVRMAYNNYRTPETKFFLALQPLLDVARQDPKIKNYTRRIFMAVIGSWYRSHPPMQPKPPDEESQMYNFGYDWVAVEEDEDPDPDRETAREVFDALRTTKLEAQMWQGAIEAIRNDEKQHARGYLQYWVGHKLLENQGDSKMMVSTVFEGASRLRDIGWIEEAPRKRRFTDVTVLLSLLQYYPKATKDLTRTSQFVEAFLVSLVGVDDCEISLWSDYVSRVLSLGLPQHALLHLTPEQVPEDIKSGNRKFTRQEYLKFRVDYLKGLFVEMERLIVEGDSHVVAYMKLIRENVFSVSRNNMMTVRGQGNQDETYRDYLSFCNQIKASMLSNPGLAKRDEMEPWVRWVP